MHAEGPGADERLQESAAMIANYPARVPVCETSLFPFLFPLPAQTLGRKGLPLLLFFVFTSLVRRLVVDHTALCNFHRVLLLFSTSAHPPLPDINHVIAYMDVDGTKRHNGF